MSLGRQRYPLLFAAWEHFRSNAPPEFEACVPSVGRELNAFLTPPAGIYDPDYLYARKGPYVFEITIELSDEKTAAHTAMNIVPRTVYENDHPDAWSNVALSASTFAVAVKYVVDGACTKVLAHAIGIPSYENDGNSVPAAAPPVPAQHREPGELLRTAHHTFCGVAERVPFEFCPTAEAKAALSRLLTETFPMLYLERPLQLRMRAEGGGCEFRVRQIDLEDGTRAHNLAFVSKAAFERAYLTPDALSPGERFGVAVLFCDASGGVLHVEPMVMPAGEGVQWPPPLTFIPHLDPLCNVLYHVADTAPLDLFDGVAERRDMFRDDLFKRIIPSIYQESTTEHREAGRAFVLTVPADPSQNFRVRVAEEDAPNSDWMYDGVEPGESFALIINFEAGDASHFVMPCLETWPTPLVLEWLEERPPRDACRRCGTEERKLKLCASCKAVRYCGRDCQTTDWRRHKKECVLMTGARETEC